MGLNRLLESRECILQEKNKNELLLNKWNDIFEKNGLHNCDEVEHFGWKLRNNMILQGSEKEKELALVIVKDNQELIKKCKKISYHFEDLLIN